MAPAPGSTFTVREPKATNTDPGGPEELWLSSDPGRNVSSMESCGSDQAFNYFVRVRGNPSNHETKSTHTDSRSKARALLDHVTIVSSGLEEDSKPSIWTRSCHLLDGLSQIINAYLVDDPGRARIVREDLVAPPKLAVPILVDRGTQEVPFNWQYERRTLYLTETLVQLGQDACRWKESEAEKTGLPFVSPLPTSLDSEIHIVSSPRADASRTQARFKIAQAADDAEADFYVTLGSRVLATMESKPYCSARNIGTLVRARCNPFKQQEAGEVYTDSDTLELLLQLGSQPLAAECRQGILVADWGRLLLPYQLENGDRGDGELRLVFSSTGSYCDVREGHQACERATAESRAELSGQDSPVFSFQQFPNTVFFLLGWILQAIEDLKKDAKSVQEPEDSKAKSTQPSEDDRKSARFAESSRGAADSGTEVLPFLNSYICTSGPILGGTFAAVHLCVIDCDYLEGRKTLSPREQFKGRPAFGVVPDLGPNYCHAYMKVQRVPSTPEPESLPEARFEGPDDPPGALIPRLFGLVPSDEYPRSSADKLMLQCLRAEPIWSLLEEWRDLWGREIYHAVEAAFAELHARRVCHGDVSVSNILVEWRRVASTGSGATIAETVEDWELGGLIGEAQRQMRLSGKAYAAAARQLSELDGTQGDSGLALEVNDSPLSRLKAEIKPHVWLVDFADAVIVEDGEAGNSVLTSEAQKVTQMMERWASDRRIGG
ncbi:hypothetical protein BCV69DRAFT_298707 [Microstroma glucosiphilum]|uniref:Uncharacterized protein n=1 Tax=Pseudomicrostroma glucosiphilum TaxID=1684307 RepID=A0A316U6L2_9BASI|nr:hypothetical protein BCV69DRAFT_298707 [Pseudomicrostroma glucosiphilum]PWN20907.1 hypothetical protein BCV69DRAFT_298707 [Pseudomicrostroma glucosiphilum]